MNPNPERTLLEGFLYYFSILVRYRWLIICTTAVVAAATAAFCVVSLRLPPEKSPLPNLYTAQAVILVERGQQGALASSILSSLGIAPDASSTDTGYDQGALLVMILRSRTFLDKIAEEFDITHRYGITRQVKSGARALLQKKTVIGYDKNTASISISFQDSDPVFARDVTNRMVSLLNDWIAQNMGSSNLKQKQLLEEKVRDVKAEIDTLEMQLKTLQNRYGVLTAQDLGTSQASALAELRSQLILKEIDIKNYTTFSAIEDPKLQQLREERQNILDLISRFKAGATNAQNGSAPQENLPDVQMQFNNLTVELDVQRKIYDTLSHQFEVMKLTLEPEQAFQVMELAEVPDAKSGPKRLMITLEATLVAFLGSVAFAFFLHGLARIRRGAENTAVRAGGRR